MCESVELKFPKLELFEMLLLPFNRIVPTSTSLWKFMHDAEKA
jgi:hypothetical protein